MSAAEAKKKLLEAVLLGRHDGRDVPVHATGSLDLAILDLAATGQISLDDLSRIYPDKERLMTHLESVRSDFLSVGAVEQGTGISSLLTALSGE